MPATLSAEKYIKQKRLGPIKSKTNQKPKAYKLNTYHLNSKCREKTKSKDI